jgi:hypothetical protein
MLRATLFGVNQFPQRGWEMFRRQSLLGQGRNSSSKVQFNIVDNGNHKNEDFKAMAEAAECRLLQRTMHVIF